jgi:hypothetical protein
MDIFYLFGEVEDGWLEMRRSASKQGRPVDMVLGGTVWVSGEWGFESKHAL